MQGTPAGGKAAAAFEQAAGGGGAPGRPGIGSREPWEPPSTSLMPSLTSWSSSAWPCAQQGEHRVEGPLRAAARSRGAPRNGATSRKRVAGLQGAGSVRRAAERAQTPPAGPAGPPWLAAGSGRPRASPSHDGGQGLKDLLWGPCSARGGANWGSPACGGAIDAALSRVRPGKGG